MPVSLDLLGRLEKIDHQIANLLEERIALTQQALEEDEAAMSAGNQAEILARWAEIADEKEWDPAATNRLGQMIGQFCRVAVE